VKCEALKELTSRLMPLVNRVNREARDTLSAELKPSSHPDQIISVLTDPRTGQNYVNFDVLGYGFWEYTPL
jgi:hypothetical protein